MIRTRPPRTSNRDAQARRERIDLFLLIGQCIACLVAGAWAGEASAPRVDGAGWIGSGILIAALSSGYAAAHMLVATVLAPLAVGQLIRRIRDPRAGPMATSEQERRMQIGLNLLIAATFVSMALTGAALLWVFGRDVSLVPALLRFGAVAIVLSLPIPRAARALG